jgi:hypothetical protein
MRQLGNYARLEIARRPREVTAEMALRLSRYFETSAQLWQNVQTQYDLASSAVGSHLFGKAGLPARRGDYCREPQPSVDRWVI